MRILIATPLYPPDIAGHAPYVKELAQRLSGTHEVTVLAYNHIPEALPHVALISVEKQKALPFRIAAYTYKLISLAPKHDIIFVQNGPSTETALIIASLFCRGRFILRLGDETPLCKAEQSFVHRMLLERAIRSSFKIVSHTPTSPCSQRLALKRIGATFVDVVRPLTKPEILPFTPYPAALFDAYESSWKDHISELHSVFSS